MYERVSVFGMAYLGAGKQVEGTLRRGYDYTRAPGMVHGLAQGWPRVGVRRQETDRPDDSVCCCVLREELRLI